MLQLKHPDLVHRCTQKIHMCNGVEKTLEIEIITVVTHTCCCGALHGSINVGHSSKEINREVLRVEILPFVLIIIVIDTPILVLLVFAGIVLLLELGFLLIFWKIPLHSTCGHFNMLYFTVLVFSRC